MRADYSANCVRSKRAIKVCKSNSNQQSGSYHRRTVAGREEDTEEHNEEHKEERKEEDKE